MAFNPSTQYLLNDRLVWCSTFSWTYHKPHFITVTVSKTYRWSIISKSDLCSMLLLLVLVDPKRSHSMALNAFQMSRICERDWKTVDKEMMSHPFFWLDQSSLFFLFTDKEWGKTLGRVNGAWWWWWSEYPGALKPLAHFSNTRRVQCSMTSTLQTSRWKLSLLDRSVQM